MNMKLIDGRKIAQKIEEEIKKSITPPAPSYLKRGRFGLAAILVGDNPESRLYVSIKEKAAKRVGIKFKKILYLISPPSSPLALRALPPDDRGEILEQKIINKIKELNKNPDITGIIVQLPLPKNLNTNKIIQSIDPKKDVDGYHPDNLKKFRAGDFPFFPPVLGAVVEILKSIKSPLPPFSKGGLKGDLKIVLVSNSKIFPIPFQSYFGKNLTVCKFKDIKKCLPSADIIITAVGKKHYLKSDHTKKGATVIDVGIVREGKKIYGDADPKSLAKKAAHLTPVPGGVGPVTVAYLLKNAAKK